MRRLALLAVLACAIEAMAADFGSPRGPEPANLDAVGRLLRQDRYALELLISFGTSKGGSAGHLALSIRDDASDDERVYSANFYADRAREHESGFYTDDLMLNIAKQEYLYKTFSSLGESASFGLDFGEIYKRSVIGVRVYGVPSEERKALAAYFGRINDDYHQRRSHTEYHAGEIKYDYLRLNCAKTIASAFHFGAGYSDLEITSAKVFTRRRVVAAAKANIPTETAIKLIKAWHQRGYAMDAVLYRKYAGSTYVDPHDEAQIAFKDLPNRFPSVLSRDFRSDEGDYQDFDNLFAMYLLYNLGKYSVHVDEQSKLLKVKPYQQPMAYPEAAEVATRNARSDSKNFRLLRRFLPQGTKVGGATGDETEP